MTRLTRRDWLALAGLGGASLGLRALPVSAEAVRGASATDASFPGEWTFGDVKVTKVLDVIEPFDAARAYPGAPLEEFVAQAAWLPPYFYDPAQKAIIFSFHSYLLRTRHLTMIVDTCWGEDTPLRRGQHRGQWLRNLAAAGVRPEDVDVVTCTHFHSDHIGWNTRLQDGRWVPTFPKAQHFFSRAEIEGLEAGIKAGRTNPLSYEQSVRPVLESGRVIRLDGEHEVTDGIRIVPATGHTPGHQCVEIDSKGRRAVLTGDLLHNPIEVRHPEWVKVFDQDKQAAMAQRMRFLDAHTDVDRTIFAAHFSGPTAGHVVSTPGGRIFRTLGS